MSKKEGRIYMCDPEKNTECSKRACYIYGGGCRRTRHPEFAVEVTEDHLNDHWEDWSDELCGRLAKQMGESDCGDSCPIGGAHGDNV